MADEPLIHPVAPTDRAARMERLHLLQAQHLQQVGPAEQHAAQKRAEAPVVATGPLEMLRLLKERTQRNARWDPAAKQLADNIAAILEAYPQGAEFTAKDWCDAQRYQFVRVEGAMWFTGKHVWRSSHRLDIEIDMARDAAARQS